MLHGIYVLSRWCVICFTEVWVTPWSKAKSSKEKYGYTYIIFPLKILSKVKTKGTINSTQTKLTREVHKTKNWSFCFVSLLNTIDHMTTALLLHTTWQQMHLSVQHDNSCTSLYNTTTAAPLCTTWQQLHLSVQHNSCTSLYNMTTDALLCTTQQQLHLSVQHDNSCTSLYSIHLLVQLCTNYSVPETAQNSLRKVTCWKSSVTGILLFPVTTLWCQ